MAKGFGSRSGTTTFGGKQFRESEAGMRQLARSRLMANALRVTSTKIKDEAQASAPVGATGRYSRGFKVAAGVNHNGDLVGRVRNDDFKAHWIEFGTIHMAARAVLARAVESVTGKYPTDRTNAPLGRRETN